MRNISTRAGSGAGTPVRPGQLPQAAAVMPEQRPGAVQQIRANRDQHSPSDSALVDRKVWALNADPQQRVPENQARHELMRERGALRDGPDGVPPAAPDLPVRHAATAQDKCRQYELSHVPVVACRFLRTGFFVPVSSCRFLQRCSHKIFVSLSGLEALLVKNTDVLRRKFSGSGGVTLAQPTFVGNRALQASQLLEACHFTGTDRVERQQLAAGPRLSDIPSRCDLLAGLTGVPPAALGVALGLSAHEIRETFNWCEPRLLVRAFLNELDLPLSLNKLACQLERSPLVACAVASQIRALGDRHGVRHLTSENSRTLVPDLEPLLEPLVGDLGRLGTALGMPESRLAPFREGELSPGREREDSLVASVVDSGLARRRKLMPSKPELTYEEWINLLARAGAGVDLERVAGTWRLESSLGFSSWRSYQRYVVSSVTDELMYDHELDPDAPVLLHKVWTALSAYASDVSFSLALDDGTDLRSILERGRWDHAGLFSLVKHVMARDDDGYCLSGSALRNLILSEMVPMPVVARLPPSYWYRSSVEETDSRRLSPADLTQLSLADRPELDALYMAVALGVGAVPISQQLGLDVRSRAACIWQRIYSRCPGLETGQLMKVFVQFRKLDLLLLYELTHQNLRAQDNARLEPSASAFLPRIEQFIRLGLDLPHCGRLVDKFIRTHNLEKQPGFSVLPGREPHWCLLNCLALDPQLLESWSRFARAEHLSTLKEGDGETATACKGDCDPDDYICPISLTYMEDPVAIFGKHNVRRFFSEKWLRQSLETTGPFHPLTREDLSMDDIPPVDKKHLKHIHAWRVSHPEEEEDGKPFVPPCRQQMAQADSDEDVSATPPE